MSISIKDIYKAFGAKRVLSGASLFVPDGAAACLQGPNGCGKTTLLKIVSTLALPDKGKVNSRSEELAYIASGEGGFYQTLTLWDNLLFFGRMRGISDNQLKESIGSLAERFGITEWLKAPLSHCSSGIRRKAAVLRAALAKPMVYLIDEFSASLDETSREIVCEFLRDEIKRGCACLVVSHDPLDGKRLNAAMYQLDDGVIKPA